MAQVNIPAHVDGATVEVFEPRQHPDQEEVILDRFELLPGESRPDYNLRSATAGIRYLPLGDETRRRFREGQEGAEPVSVGAGGIENPYGIVPTEEMDAGRDRQQELEKMEKDREREEAKRTKSGSKDVQPSALRTANVGAERSTGAEAAKQYGEGVKEKGEAKRGSDEPHPGTPNELGQPVGSPAAHITGTGTTDFGPERTFRSYEAGAPLNAPTRPTSPRPNERAAEAPKKSTTKKATTKSYKKGK